MNQSMRPVVVGLMGYAGTGKDSVAHVLKAKGYTHLAFADILKDVAYDLFPDLRDIIDMHGPERAKRDYPTVRFAYQRLGQTLRVRLGEDVWINALRQSIKTLTDANVTERFVISDVRYANEAQMIMRYQHGYLIGVNRPGFGPVNDHDSEKLPGIITPEFWIQNDGTLQDLHNKVTDAASALGLPIN